MHNSSRTKVSTFWTAPRQGRSWDLRVNPWGWTHVAAPDPTQEPTMTGDGQPDAKSSQERKEERAEERYPRLGWTEGTWQNWEEEEAGGSEAGDTRETQAVAVAPERTADQRNSANGKVGGGEEPGARQRGKGCKCIKESVYERGANCTRLNPSRRRPQLSTRSVTGQPQLCNSCEESYWGHI